MSRSVSTLVICTLIAGSLNSLFATPLAAQRDYKKVFSEYEAYLRRPSLFKRNLGRKKLAATKDLRALHTLIKDYAKPEDPKDYVRYLIAGHVMKYFGRNAPEQTLKDWRKRNKKPSDAWLWYQTLRYGPTKANDILTIARARGDIYCKAAAFEAATQKIQRSASDTVAAEAALQILANLPKKGVERALVLENIAALLLKKKRIIRQDPWRTVASQVIATFEDPGTEQRTKIVMSRYFSEIFGIQNIGFQAQWWLSELNKQSGGNRRSSGNTVTASFFGIRTMGDHIVYVIDASDSMLKRVSDLEKKSLGPTTGKKKAKKKGGIVPTGADLDWGRIQTRFDVAREFLRVSLETLQPHQNFAVILFGTKAVPLDATPKIIRATKGNIKRAIAELNKIEGGPATDKRPDGVLRGDTNLHGGFRYAFRMTRGGLTKKAEYADKKAMLSGCDTIFMLSDGQPSTDDWVTRDSADPEDKAGDMETGASHEKTPFLFFKGPYVMPDALVPDISRLNLLRRAEIHCVGIGEANHQILKDIARIGHGKAMKIDHKNR